MAAKAIVAERQSVAIGKIQEHVRAITESLGIEPVLLDEHVQGGDAPYKEMVRAEQLATLLGAVREKVSPAPRKPVEEVSETPVARLDVSDKQPVKGKASHGKTGKGHN